MPELPEVETVRRGLQSSLSGRRIAAVDVRLPRLIRSPEPEAFCRRLVGRTFGRIDRRGKYLLLALSPDVLVVHLRMEGKFDLVPAGTPEPPHVHVVFLLDDGRELRYRDVRQFGTFDLVPEAHLAAFPPLAALGPDALDPAWDLPALLARLGRHRRRPIKALLLDQTIVAGIGNIYADEALFRAGIHPRRPAGSLRPDEAAALWSAVRGVLEDGIARGGASVRSYRGPNDALGYFQLALAVYGREGEPCPRCGTAIERTVVAGRGSRFCPRCQPEVGAENGRAPSASTERPPASAAGALAACRSARHSAASAAPAGEGRR
ncbi:bifunctional DNA-formamidopyrimidine glycosylase/DNA-(apurinic or apyrimidinic site) lyase [Hydrogenibacillus schlegelii]|uniref:bifunctional DNA-formamidopyrimidine glycosylase/DNA-(apurinic or apyrimidinic site) lyase n=2 Tax=Hydrogenibacillus schlegelii TaxID=1484 RepID=UPI000824E1DC